jgi:decaprenyl-phosphate phosphoribosyltransferase
MSRLEEHAAVPSSTRSRRSLPAALFAEARPKQWVKNVLVLAAPGAAGVIRQQDVLVNTAIAFICFCLVASGTYYLNDANDVDADRQHPTKRFRPIAAGEIPVGLARMVGVGLLVSGLALAFATRWQLGVVVAVYVALTTSYTIWLKHIPVVDVVAVAAGFVLRAIAGGAVNTPDITISNWFFILTSFGSLFVVAGKRSAEFDEMGEEATSTRAALGEYSASYLAYLRSVTSGVLMVAYCLWAFEKAAEADHFVPWFQLSILWFVLAILRYALLIDAGRGGAPEELILSDRTLMVFGAIWAVTFAAGIYLD